MAMYKVGDLVWAKMKGYPPWPAQVLESSPDINSPTALTGRQLVLFFGTHETAHMKPDQLYPYEQYRVQYEIARKLRGFNEGIEEIRNAAGIAPAPIVDDISSSSELLPIIHDTNETSKQSEQSSPTLSSNKIDQQSTTSDISRTRTRKPNSKFVSDQFISSFDVRRNSSSDSATRRDKLSVIRKVTKTEPIAKISFIDDELKSTTAPVVVDDVVVDETKPQQCNDRNKRAKRVSISDRISIDTSSQQQHPTSSLMSEPFDNVGSTSSAIAQTTDPTLYSPMLSSVAYPDKDDATNGLEPDEGVRHSRRTPKPRVFGDDFVVTSGGGRRERASDSISTTLPPHRSPRNRALSISSTRTRLISGVSDVFEEIGLSIEPIAGFSASDLMSAMEDLPSEGSGREMTPPGDLTQLPLPIKFCSECGCQCRLLTSDEQVKWRCTSKFCAKWNGNYESCGNDGQVLLSNNTGNVEKTPPVAANGMRLCTYCGSQVRPQMCGGNKHRWRCVDKKCRKWYGWVRSNEEVPDDLGKKGRWKAQEIELKLKRQRVLSTQTDKSDTNDDDDDDQKLVVARKVTTGKSPKSGGLKIRLKTKRRISDKRNSLTNEECVLIADSNTKPDLSEIDDAECSVGQSLMDDDEMMQKIATDETTIVDQVEKPKKKKAKFEVTPDESMNTVVQNIDSPKTESNRHLHQRPPTLTAHQPRPVDITYATGRVSPLPAEALNYRMTLVEQKSRWWTSEKARRRSPSPRRPFSTDIADSAAVFRLIGRALEVLGERLSNRLKDGPAPNETLAGDETSGAVDGTLDFMMDTLMSSFAPLFSLLRKGGATCDILADDELHRLWEACAVHTPMLL